MDFLNVMGNNCSGSHANVLLKHPKHTSHGQGMKAPVQSWRAAMLKRFPHYVTEVMVTGKLVIHFESHSLFHILANQTYIT